MITEKTIFILSFRQVWILPAMWTSIINVEKFQAKETKKENPIFLTKWSWEACDIFKIWNQSYRQSNGFLLLWTLIKILPQYRH